MCFQLCSKMIYGLVWWPLTHCACCARCARLLVPAAPDENSKRNGRLKPSYTKGDSIVTRTCHALGPAWPCLRPLCQLCPLRAFAGASRVCWCQQVGGAMGENDNIEDDGQFGNSPRGVSKSTGSRSWLQTQSGTSLKLK